MDKILIAFSGGPDSVFLYYYLKNKGYNLALCYVNHNLRDDVENDIEFVTKFAMDNNCEYLIKQIKLDNFSEQKARTLRYEKLQEACLELKCDKIATGHNKNDNVETIIFRMIRGTGIQGLKGIKRQRDNILRPILDYSKEQILDYLDNNNIKYLTDYTNLENKYSRNIIRNKIFPIMHEINPNFIDHINDLIIEINEQNELSETIIEKLKEKNIKYTRNKINEIINIKNKTGKFVILDDKYSWYSSYNYYGVIQRNDTVNNFKKIELKLGENIDFNGYDIYFCDQNVNYFNLEKKGYKIYNVGNSDKLIIRNRISGDKIGNKKVKDILIKNKIDLLLRDKIPIVECDDKIICIADIKSILSNDNIKNFIAIRKGINEEFFQK